MNGNGCTQKLNFDHTLKTRSIWPT